MTYLSKADLNRIVGQSYKSVRFSQSIQKAVIAEKTHDKTYDIFLSHSHLDSETVFQINYLLEEELGLDVYVDEIEDANMDRSAVTPETAAHLRNVMDRCASLVYAISVNSAASKWMPWELGYSDGRHRRVAVLPITGVAATAVAYANQEFVGIYPYVDLAATESGISKLWINDPKNAKRYADFAQWKRTGTLTDH